MRRAMLCLAVFAAVLTVSGCGRDDSVEISYNPDFTSLVTEGKVTKVEIVQEPSGVAYILGQTRPGDSPGQFKVYITAADQNLRQFLTSNNVQFTVPPQNPVMWKCLSGAVPLLILFVWVALVIFLLTLAVRLVRALEQIARNTKKE